MELAKLKELQAKLDADRRRLEALLGHDVPNDDLAMVMGYFVGYPMFHDWIGATGDPHPDRIREQDALNYNHIMAARIMMQMAKMAGLDDGPLWDFARVCRELFEAEPETCHRGRESTWPECLGLARWSLPPETRQTIDQGERVLIQLANRHSTAGAAKQQQGEDGKAGAKELDPAVEAGRAAGHVDARSGKANRAKAEKGRPKLDIAEHRKRKAIVLAYKRRPKGQPMKDFVAMDVCGYKVTSEDVKTYLAWARVSENRKANKMPSRA